MRGNVALLAEHILIEAGIARPRLQHTQEEIEAVHLGLNQPPVVGVGGGPAGCSNCVQASAIAGKVCGFPRHRRRTVIGDAGPNVGLYECPPVSEEHDEVCMSGDCLGRGRGLRWSRL